MADLEVHTADGWVKLADIINARENCDICGVEGRADRAGYQDCADDLIIWFCLDCRVKPHD